MSVYDLDCPYCHAKIDDPDDCYEPDKVYQHQCHECEKYFTFTIDYIRDYSSEQADCLNGAEHDYKETTTYPKRYTRLVCSMCDDRKSVSPERLAELIAMDDALSPTPAEGG
jgi:hypothetical protein